MTGEKEREREDSENSAHGSFTVATFVHEVGVGEDMEIEKEGTTGMRR